MFEHPEEKLKDFVVFLFWIVLIGSVIAAIVLSVQSEALIGPAILGCIGLNLINYLSALLIKSYLNLCSNTQSMTDIILSNGNTSESPYPDAIPVSKANFDKAYKIVHIDDSTIRSKLKNAGIDIGAELTVHTFEDGKFATEINSFTVSVSQDAAKHIFIKPIEE